MIFLEQAELRVKQQRDLTLEFWQNNLDRMLAFNDQPLLEGLGNVSHEEMKHTAQTRYESFDQKRQQRERLEADADDLQSLEALEQQLKGHKQ